ncbi:BUR1 [[Candida] subhashii]|uniref:Serine/threonine-protein kinase BUR1 n=1 Tax=[Candida] subhashii TaxID=561895 RepID=A0A8J5UUI2_9ASCO|nr:BUR1 [[Candida] subhashii]KAG7665912.1 BUR1 [[Candida] subhashii]
MTDTSSSIPSATNNHQNRKVTQKPPHLPDSKGHIKEMSRLKEYEIIQKLGQGTFGVVQKAKSNKTGELVALKQLINHSAKEGFPITAMREITILRRLHHKNVINIVDMIYEEPKVSNPTELITQRGVFYTVSPYMSSDLVGLLENPNVNLELAQIKCFMQQLLYGIQYIHEQRFLHRDIKAANLLIDFNGILKIADFGLARVYHGDIPKLARGPGGGERAYTGLVVTRWYRPPELLLGERKYTTAVDLWGIGCVFAELFTRKPILVGKSDAHQAQLVFELVGPPLNWPEAAKLPNKTDFNIGLTCKRSLESRFENIIPLNGIKLLSGLLTLDPFKRFNALDALDHDFFINEPLPMKPEELPKFEECHEIDKERFKKLRKNGATTSGFHRVDSHPSIAEHSTIHRGDSHSTIAQHPVVFEKSRAESEDRFESRYVGTTQRKVDSYIPKQKSSSNLSTTARIRENADDDRRNRYVNYRSVTSESPQKPRSPSKADSTHLKSGGSSESPPSPVKDLPTKPKFSISNQSTITTIPEPSSASSTASSELPPKPSVYEEYSKRQTSDNLTSKIRGVGTVASIRNRAAVVPTVKVDKANPPSKKPINIFMSTHKRQLSGNSLPLPSKRKKFVEEMDPESELSEIENDFTNNEEASLEGFLDIPAFKKDSEYRKVANEKVKYLKSEKIEK